MTRSLFNYYTTIALLISPVAGLGKMGRKDAVADPNEPADPMRAPIAGCDLAPHRLLRDANRLGDLGDA